MHKTLSMYLDLNILRNEGFNVEVEHKETFTVPTGLIITGTIIQNSVLDPDLVIDLERVHGTRKTIKLQSKAALLLNHEQLLWALKKAMT